jgi:hypothetical protein
VAAIFALSTRILRRPCSRLGLYRLRPPPRKPPPPKPWNPRLPNWRPPNPPPGAIRLAEPTEPGGGGGWPVAPLFGSWLAPPRPANPCAGSWLAPPRPPSPFEPMLPTRFATPSEPEGLILPTFAGNLRWRAHAATAPTVKAVRNITVGIRHAITKTWIVVPSYLAIADISLAHAPRRGTTFIYYGSLPCHVNAS